MKVHRLFLSLLAGMLLPSVVFGSIQLNSFYSRAVKDGYTVSTSIDTLKMSMRVNSGVATSSYMLTLTPGMALSYETVLFSDTFKTEGKQRSLDSIEITLNFQMPTDFVSDSMWLWVEGKRVPAYIQDRALASQQYQQIVGTRRDPAILETWGNGSYSLRIFPASSLKSRKIEMQFHHLFDDDMINGKNGLVAASVPLQFDSAQVYDPQGIGLIRKIGFVEAKFIATDDRNYSASIPGLGNGTFSAGSILTLSGSNIAKLDTGSVNGEDPSGTSEYLWTGKDAGSELFTAGLTTDFDDNALHFEPEPDTRIIVLDMRSVLWNWNEYYRMQAETNGNTYSKTGYEVYNIWDRAQKYAVLALQQYLKNGQKFNVLIGGKEVTSVFSAPVEVSDENIEQAINAILSAVPTNESSTIDLLEAASVQAPKGIVILISDLFQPYDYQILTDKVNYIYSISNAGKVYDSTILMVKNIVNEAGFTLFTVNDAWQISQCALQSGGFQLGGLLNRYNIQYKYEVIDGSRISLPQLPALFGSGNGSGIRNLSITSEHLNDIVYTVDGNYGRYYSGGISTVEGMKLDKLKRVESIAYYSSYQKPGRMLIAGRTTIENSGKPVTVTIRGKLDGLWFSRVITASGSYNPATSAYVPDADQQWAFRKSEQLAFNDYTGNAGLIKAIGKDYHIVTRQTSLLALEPGMQLWEDTVWQQQAQKTDAMTGGMSSREMTVADQISYTTVGGASTSAIGNGVDFDGISLESILKKNSISVQVSRPQISRQLSVTMCGTIVHVNLPSEQVSTGAYLRLYDLKGRLVARKKIDQRDITGASLQWNIVKDGYHLSRGIYSIQISAGADNKVFRITLTGR